MEIKEHYLRNFVFWVRSLRPRHKGAELLDCEKTLEHVAQIVEQVLEAKIPLGKKRGRKSDSDTMWLYFHTVRVASITSKDPPLPLHFQDEKGGRAGKRNIGVFVRVGKLLCVAPKTVGDNYYKALPLWNTRKGRQDYIDWLNHREKRWEAHQARLNRRDPTPREYARAANDIGVAPRLNHLENDVENYIVPLSAEDIELLVNEAQKLLEFESGNADYYNWLKHRDAGLLYLRPKAGHKRRNI